MTKVLAVDKETYQKLRTAEDGTVVSAVVHSHGKLSGTVEVVAKGRKPIACIIAPDPEAASIKRGVTSARIRVVLTKK